MLLRLLFARQGYRFAYFLLLLELLAIGAPSAAIAAPADLLKYQQRPTVAEFLHEVGPWPANNPFSVSYSLTQFSILPQVAEDELARQIALLELLFPGATFAPLGRDVVWFGDALDAFYTALGQKDRVSRLNASGPSFDGSVESNLRFLQDAGFDPSNLASTPALVGFDRTSLSPGQLGRLFHTMYTKLRATFGASNPELIAKKLNLFTFNGANSSPLALVTNASQAIALKETQVANLKNSEWPGIFPTFNYNNLNGSLVDSRLFWHDSFGRFTIVNGKLQGSLGTPSNNDNRVACLHFMYDIFSKVSKPQFLAKVQYAAKSLGYEFPIQKVSGSIAPQINFEIAEHAVAFRSILKQLGQIAPDLEQPKYFSANGRLVANWFENSLPLAKLSDKTTSLFMLYIEGVNVAMKSNQITNRDYRRLVAKGLSGLDTDLGFTPSREFIEWFRGVFSNEINFNRVWMERANYFLDETPSRRGGVSVPRVYNSINKAFGLDPRSGSCELDIAG